MNSFSISVVLPAYNEEENIKNTLLNCINFLNKGFEDYEVIAVNDGSSDRTKEEIKKMMLENSRIKLVDHAVNQGYGAALNSGFESAVKDYIFLMDSDGQFDISDMDLMIPLVTGQNVVLGYRTSRADNMVRSLNAYLYSLYIRLFFGLEVKDIDCAFKLFPKSAFDSVKPLKSRGALYSAELLIKFVRNGFEIKEVSVKHYPRTYGEQSGANLNVILKMFKESWDIHKDLR